MYVCITESLCTAEIKHNTVNQLYFNKIKNKNRVPPKPGTEITQMLLVDDQKSSHGCKHHIITFSSGT